MLTCAVLLLVAAEWPRLAERFGLGEREGRAPRRRRRRRGGPDLTVIHGEAADHDDFAASVQRDLANLPVIEERDGRSRR
jgi:hypothetical protein